MYKLIILSITCFTLFVNQAFSQKTYTDKEAFDLMKTIQPTPFVRNSNPNAQWFPLAGFGLFIHWGIHSVAALEPSWDMIKNCPWVGYDRAWSPEEYYNLAKEFNPQSYDPEKWVLAAKEAGFQYVVLTAKHHDGYCLWPTKYGVYNTDKQMGGRDLIRPYVAACKKYGLKVGIYFSPRDWSYPGFPVYPDFSFKNTAKPYTPAELNQQKFDAFFDYLVGQMSELLTNYGNIDVLWFDSHEWPGVDSHSQKLHAWLRQIQPGMVVNPRWETFDDKLPFGDFRTEEVNWANNADKSPCKEGEWWEFCRSWSGGWGYSPMRPFTDIHETVKILVSARSFGGNYLLDIGPAPDGTMRPGFYNGCNELGVWMKNNKESVIGTQGVMNWKDICGLPMTKKDNCYYVHLLKDASGNISIKNLTKPQIIKLLESGEIIPFQFAKNVTTVQISDTKRKFIDDVLKIEF